MTLKRLQAGLGYEFRDARLAERALTHRSCGGEHNERLEFLGDGLLNFVVAESLYLRRPQADEGDLSRMRASLVREETLADLARELALGEHVRLGSGELKSGGFRRDSILADVLEALVGAVYLDGGFESARALCLRLYGERLETLPDAAELKDAKTRLQERLQAAGRPLPEYALIESAGPPHNQRFKVQCRLPDSGATSEGVARSRRLAEQAAAEAALHNGDAPIMKDEG